MAYPKGKSGSGDFNKAGVLLRKDLHREAKRRKREAEDAGLPDIDVSDLVNAGLEIVLSGDWIRLPVLGSVSAGVGVIAEDDIRGYISVSDSLSRGAAFALEVDGASMAPTLQDGDTILVRRQTEAENNQIVVAALEGEDHPAGREGVVKRLRRDYGLAELRSDNEEYGTVTGGFSIVGIVVTLIRDME